MFLKTDLTVITSFNYIITTTVAVIAVIAVDQRETKTFTNDFAVRWLKTNFSAYCDERNTYLEIVIVHNGRLSVYYMCAYFGGRKEANVYQ